MRSRLIAILACAAALAVAVLAHLATWEIAEEEFGSDRYVQHGEVAWLDDLSKEDQEAASSLSTDPETFASHLPVVSIDTGGQAVPGEVIPEISREEALEKGIYRYTVADDGSETISASFSLFSQDGHANRLSDEPALETRAEIRYRGNSSRRFDKKGYTVHFTLEDRVTQNDQDVLDMGADDDWILHGPFLDKTLIRNYLGMNVSGQIMYYAPDVRLCELFLNGEYQGVYLLMESIKVSPERLNLTESDPSSEATSYVVRRDWEDPTSESELTNLLYNAGIPRHAVMEVVYPGASNITEEQSAWIESDVNYLEKCLYSYDYDTHPYAFTDLADVDTFVDYAIINELWANVDAGSYSTYFYKDARGKICAGPVWDFNNAFNNYSDDDQTNLGFIMPSQPVYFMIFKDEDVVERAISRYRDLREGPLSDEYLLEFIDEAIAYLGPAIERNYAVWGYSFDAESLNPSNRLNPVERNPASFEEAVQDMKDFIVGRGALLDRNIENLRQYSHESINKRYNH